MSAFLAVMFLDCSWTLSKKKKKKEACIRAEDSIQRPRQMVGVRCSGNSPYLRCKFLKELKEPEKQVSKEVCCCVGEQGRERGWLLLNDNTGCIEIRCVRSGLCSTSNFLCLATKCKKRGNSPSVQNPRDPDFIHLNVILVQKQLIQMRRWFEIKCVNRSEVRRNILIGPARSIADLQAPGLINVIFEQNHFSD